MSNPDTNSQTERQSTQQNQTDEQDLTITAEPAQVDEAEPEAIAKPRRGSSFMVSYVPPLANLRNWSREDTMLWLRQFTLLVVGLFFFALALVLSLLCNLGANSWMVFHDGIEKVSFMTIGQAAWLVSLVMIFVSWGFGIRPGIGTVLNMFLVGLYMDLILWSGLIPRAEDLPVQIGMMAVAVVMLGISSGVYIKAGFGAGPRDSFNLALSEITGKPISVTRWGIEAIVVVIGILMGGQFGIGTVIFAILIGPAVGYGFRIVGLHQRPRPDAKLAT